MDMDRSSSVDLSSAPVSDVDLPKLGEIGDGPSPPPHASAQKVDAVRARRADAAATAAAAGESPATSRQEQAGTTKKVPKPRKPRAAKTTKPKTIAKAPKLEAKPEAGFEARSEDVSWTGDLQSSRLNQPVNLHQSLNPPAGSAEAAKTSQNGLLIGKPELPGGRDTANTLSWHEGADSTASAVPQNQPTPPPRSTPWYDPVRGLTSQRAVEPPHTSPSVPAPAIVHTPPRSSGRPSASPIASIIDPVPGPLQPSAPSPLRSFVSNSDGASKPLATETLQQPPPQPPQHPSTEPAPAPSAMDLDTPLPNGKTAAPVAKKPASEAAARPGSPKPARAKEQPPVVPLPTGSGLLSATLFGGESGLDANEDKVTGPNIVLHIDLKDPKNKVINFARLAEEKYGFAALYPRQAAQKERLARVAAAGAALERSASASKHGGTSAGDSGDDDVSVDIDRDSDGDGDVNMGGYNGGNEPANSGTDGPEPKRRRRKKVEEYDQDDPFIDDSEQLWEAQAAASKDGFFVYSGPLVPEGEKATVERADGSVRRGGRGRGRGGGPGSRGGRGARAAAAAASATSAAATDADSAATTTTTAARPATGPGSRGGSAARKPRAKKAEAKQPQQQDKDKEGELGGQAAGLATSTPTLKVASSYQQQATAQPV